MRRFAIIDKASGAEVWRYTSETDTPIEWVGWEFDSYEHRLLPLEPEAPAPARPTLAWSQAVFLRRLTPEERIAIRGRAKTDPVVEDLLDILYRAQEVVNDDPDLLRGLAYLTSVGDLAEGRAEEILYG